MLSSATFSTPIGSGRMPQTSQLTKDLLQMHNAGIGADVVDGLRLLGLIDVVVVEDIVEGQRLLRVRDWSACHDGQDGLEHTNKTEI